MSNSTIFCILIFSRQSFLFSLFISSFFLFYSKESLLSFSFGMNKGTKAKEGTVSNDV